MRELQESCDIIYCVEEPDYVKNNKKNSFLNQKIISTFKKGCILFFLILEVRSLNRICSSIQIKITQRRQATDGHSG